MILTKIEAAEVNLRTAIRLHFQKAHPVSIETLNAAASGILRPMAQKRDIELILHDSIAVSDEYRKDWIKLLHGAQNFFKHADRDENEVFEYKEKMSHLLLLETCKLYTHLASKKHLSHRQLKEGLIYQIWFALKYPHYLIDQNSLKLLPDSDFLLSLDPNDFELWYSFLDNKKA